MSFFNQHTTGSSDAIGMSDVNLSGSPSASWANIGSNNGPKSLHPSSHSYHDRSFNNSHLSSFGVVGVVGGVGGVGIPSSSASLTIDTAFSPPSMTTAHSSDEHHHLINFNNDNINEYRATPSNQRHIQMTKGQTSTCILAIVAVLFLFSAAWYLGAGSPPLLTYSRSILSGGEFDMSPVADRSIGILSTRHDVGGVSRDSSSPPRTVSATIDEVREESQPRVTLRIITAGTSGHAELDRLLKSIQSARYDIGIDLIDIEFWIDWPKNLTGHHTNLDDENGPTFQEHHNDPYYLEAKYEYDLTMLLVRNFQWIHGSIRIHTVEPTTPHMSGIFHAFTSWRPSIPKHDTTATNSNNGVADEQEFALYLLDSNVVGPMYFQVLKHLLKRYGMKTSNTNMNDGVTDGIEPNANPENIAIFGFLLEPAMSLVGSSSSNSWEEVTLASIIGSSNAAAAPSTHSILFGQLSHTPSGIGGMVVGSRAFLSFTSWLSTHHHVHRDTHGGGRISSEFGSPTAMVLDRTKMERVCVPNFISNLWVPEIQRETPDEVTTLELIQQRESWLKERSLRSHFLLQLLQRFIWEHGFIFGIPIFQHTFMGVDVHNTSSVGPTLISSSSFRTKHSHRDHLRQHEDGGYIHTHDHEDHQHVEHEIHPGHAEQQPHQHSLEGHEEVIPLSPLNNILVQDVDLSYFSRHLTPITSVFDFHGRFVSSRDVVRGVLLQGGGLDPDSVSSSHVEESCQLLPGTPQITQPEFDRPLEYESHVTLSNLDELHSSSSDKDGDDTNRDDVEENDENLSLEERFQKQKLKKNDENGDMNLSLEQQFTTGKVQIEPSTTPSNTKASTPSTSKPSSTSASASSTTKSPSSSPLESNKLVDESAAGVPSLNLTGLSQSELISIALKTAESHVVDLPVSPLLNRPDDRLDLNLLHDNLTTIEQRRWEDYEADFQFSLQQISSDSHAVEEAMSHHAGMRVSHEDYLTRIREELEKKKLVQHLRTQLEEIDLKERDSEVDKKIELYRKRQKYLNARERKRKKKTKKRQQHAATPIVVTPVAPINMTEVQAKLFIPPGTSASKERDMRRRAERDAIRYAEIDRKKAEKAAAEAAAAEAGDAQPESIEETEPDPPLPPELDDGAVISDAEYEQLMEERRARKKKAHNPLHM